MSFSPFSFLSCVMVHSYYSYNHWTIRSSLLFLPDNAKPIPFFSYCLGKLLSFFLLLFFFFFNISGDINFEQRTLILIRVKLRYIQFIKSSTLNSYLNSNTLNLNILGKDNIVYVLLVNATIYLNSIGEPNVLDLRNYI